jgi:hypothetical protein
LAAPSAAAEGVATTAVFALHRRAAGRTEAEVPLVLLGEVELQDGVQSVEGAP